MRKEICGSLVPLDMNRLTALAIVLLTASACASKEEAPDSSSANTYSGTPNGGVAVTKTADGKPADPAKPLDPAKPSDPAKTTDTTTTKTGDGTTGTGGTDTKTSFKTGMIMLSQVQTKPD